jgi:hypothetical protein
MWNFVNVAKSCTVRIHLFLHFTIFSVANLPSRRNCSHTLNFLRLDVISIQPKHIQKTSGLSNLILNKMFALTLLGDKIFSLECTCVKSTNKINLGYVRILNPFKAKYCNIIITKIKHNHLLGPSSLVLIKPP